MRTDLVSFLSATFLPFYDVTRLHFLAQQKGHRTTSLNGPAAREIHYSWYFVSNPVPTHKFVFQSSVIFSITYCFRSNIPVSHGKQFNINWAKKIDLQVVLLKKKTHHEVRFI